MSLSLSFCVCVFSLVDPVESAKNIHLCLTCIHEHLHTLKQFRVVQQGATQQKCSYTVLLVFKASGIQSRNSGTGAGIRSQANQE